MRIIALGCLAALLVAGCGGRRMYESPEKSRAQEERDYAECDWEASRATAGLADGGEMRDRVEALIEKCMRARGYAPK